MSGSERKPVQTHLREARIESGCGSRNIASPKVHMAPETIGRHERGDVELKPRDVLTYAEGYEKPDLLIHFCEDCPINRMLHDYHLMEWDLMAGATRLRNRMKKAGQIADTIDNIADDNKVNDWERPEFIKALKDGSAIIMAVKELTLYGLKHGIITLEDIKKDRPAVTGTAQGK